MIREIWKWNQETFRVSKRMIEKKGEEWRSVVLDKEWDRLLWKRKNMELYGCAWVCVWESHNKHEDERIDSSYLYELLITSMSACKNTSRGNIHTMWMAWNFYLFSTAIISEIRCNCDGVKKVIEFSIHSTLEFNSAHSKCWQKALMI